MFDQDEMFEDLRQSMMRAEEENQIKGEEYNRLLADPFMGEIKEGDKVLVRASMIGRGHHWKMIEILVEKVSPNGKFSMVEKSETRGSAAYLQANSGFLVNSLLT